MTLEGVFHLILIFAIFLCSLVAGFLFAFAVVAMPGIKALPDRDFLRAFKVMDRVIQNNQPLFVVVWIGSILLILLAAVIGFTLLEASVRLILLIAVFLYLFGVQLPTVTINIPLNNKLQTLKLDELNEAALKEARAAFEPRWNRWNSFRTFISSLVSFLLILLLFNL